MFLNTADYLVGSPTALASQPVEDALRAAATSHGLYVPAGAFWGAEDILKMADRGTLKVYIFLLFGGNHTLPCASELFTF